MSKKEKLLSEIKKLSKKIGSVKVYFNQHKTDSRGMGYYFDENDKLWKSYVCGEFYFITKKSENEIDVIERLYDSVCEEVEAHEKPLEKIKKIEPELNTVSIYLNHHSCGPYAIGYFYDSKSKCWMAYRNTERGKSMYYEYDCEEEAIVGLYKLARTEYDFQHH
ncbi:MAG: hypothetical protein EGR22_10965 [Ruminococcaceae bacterium]|uniref:hypothetical protein n=1 Tax=Pseudoruminococcus massiliensis TaxID=2086583 RepID=UPI003AB4C03E|nr:hypothetical protein [Oscillospiraceae bacterium]MBE5714680.1 hypothetical protein [Oscillospiraceae bacterium]